MIKKMWSIQYYAKQFEEIILPIIFLKVYKRELTRTHLASFCQHFSFVSSIEPDKIEKALADEDWVLAMQEELNNFERNQVWTLVERPNTNVIGTRWVFRNKQDKNGVVTRNKARLVA